MEPHPVGRHRTGGAAVVPRLKFDLKPEGPWRGETVEAHNVELREQVAGWSWWGGGELQPCDCGLYVEGMVCTCRPEERRNHTPAWVAKTLEARARRKHLDALKLKRAFPAFDRCPMGVCYWCRAPIVHGRVKQRGMHDGRKDEPDCQHQYHLRTRLEAQQSHLLDRDGIGCRCCGKVAGAWARVWTAENEDRLAHWWAQDGWLKRQLREKPGPFTWVSWSTHLEVDHIIPLAAAWEAFPEAGRRRWFFGPANMQLLCPNGGCHVAKTREDVAFIKACQQNGPEWAKAEVLRRLADAGLIRSPEPKGAT